jgi:hypothetical protein
MSEQNLGAELWLSHTRAAEKFSALNDSRPDVQKRRD